MDQTRVNTLGGIGGAGSAGDGLAGMVGGPDMQGLLLAAARVTGGAATGQAGATDSSVAQSPELQEEMAEELLKMARIQALVLEMQMLQAQMQKQLQEGDQEGAGQTVTQIKKVQQELAQLMGLDGQQQDSGAGDAGSTSGGDSPTIGGGGGVPIGNGGGSAPASGSSGSAPASDSGGGDTGGTTGASESSPTSGGPPAGQPTGNVKQWIAEAKQVLQQNGVDTSKISDADLNTIIQHESGGNPHAINKTDSNAAAGHPSKGLMQTIDSTFNAYAVPGHKDIWNPVDNIVAATRYAISRYGSVANVPGVKAANSGGKYVGY